MLATWDSNPTASVTIDNLMIQHHKEESSEMYKPKSKSVNWW
jgi:hypothetical protein